MYVSTVTRLLYTFLHTMESDSRHPTVTIALPFHHHRQPRWKNLLAHSYTTHVAWMSPSFPLSHSYPCYKRTPHKSFSMHPNACSPTVPDFQTMRYAIMHAIWYSTFNKTLRTYLVPMHDQSLGPSSTSAMLTNLLTSMAPSTPLAPLFNQSSHRSLKPSMPHYS